MKKKITVACPHCKKKFDFYSSEFRPFCCEKCKMVDMGQWLTESYILEGKDYSLYAQDPEKIQELLEKEDIDDF